ncbi:MAG: hypothetical protein J0H34_17480 [Rhizobiales bacterium]|nr:hypothetical protein [Hyphomicrobiales bacterium]
MALFQSLASSATVYLLYAMGGFPFAVWAGMSTWAALRSGNDLDRPARPGRARTVFLVILPLLFIALYAFGGTGATPRHGSGGAAAPESEWGPYLFLMLPPSAGLVLGHGIALLLGRYRDGRLR